MSYLPSGQYEQDLGSTFSTVKKIGGGALDILGSHFQAKGQAQAAMELAKAQAVAQAAQKQSSGMPGWVLPAGIGAAALVLILVLKK